MMDRSKNWIEKDNGFRIRDYASYKDYLRIQAKKLEEGPGTAKKFSDGLRGGVAKRLGVIEGYPSPPLSVLCLGARLGGEVQGFIDKGYFAVGIDINPGSFSKYVLYGDFHALEYPDSCVDIIFTNSLDHVYDMDKVMAEIVRLLKPGGYFHMEAKGGVSETEFRSARSDGYDCCEWHTLEGLVEYIEGKGFDVIIRKRFRGFTPFFVLFKKRS